MWSLWFNAFSHNGLGTEQLEETLKARFPQYNIARIDRVVRREKGKLEGYLEDIQQGKSQILIGTQNVSQRTSFPECHFGCFSECG